MSTSFASDTNRILIPFQDKDPQAAPFPIVGMGASTGGLNSFASFLKAAPRDVGMAFVVIQHLDPAHVNHLVETLSNATSMPVQEVTDGASIDANCVYVSPPNVLLEIEDRRFRLTSRPSNPAPPWPIDHFFASLAAAQRRLSVGVVLSGTGSDGSEGLKAIKSVCGLTFAEHEETAQHPAMPRRAVATGIVDFILTPDQIAEELVKLGRNRYFFTPAEPPESETLPEGEAELTGIFSILLRATGLDFSHYKRNTVQRRIGRRMIAHHVDTLDAYLKYLRKHPDETKELFRDLIVNVTAFFQGPDAFSALAKQLAKQIGRKASRNSFRVWISGCSTGEELYSLAICVHELFQEAGLRPAMQFFGTDISEAALQIARAGVYSERAVQHILPERLQQRFIRADGGYQISRAIRETCIFARHDVTRDTPFTHLDLISCRNLLTCFNPVLQSAVCSVFHYALNLRGLLFLGSAEAVGTDADLFSPIDAKHNIFSRQSIPGKYRHSAPGHQKANETFTQTQVSTALTSHDLKRRVDWAIESRYAVDGVVIDTNWQILQFRGHTGFYLEPPSGAASYHLLRMARGELQFWLHEVVSVAMKQKSFIEKEGIRVEQGSESRTISLEITPLDSGPDKKLFYLVVFRRIETHTVPRSGARPSAELSLVVNDRVKSLEQQVSDVLRHQRALLEEHDLALMELRAANVELRSANEELQSGNEELKTTKEELQSANEELTTVNEELHTRNQQLANLNDDFKNLFAAVESPILRVDRDICLQRFTPAAEKAFGVNSADLKHSIRHLRSCLGTLPDIESVIRGILESLNPKTYQVQDAKGRWWSLSIRPYRTTDQRIDGAVLTFTDADINRESHMNRR